MCLPFWIHVLARSCSQFLYFFLFHPLSFFFLLSLSFPLSQEERDPLVFLHTLSLTICRFLSCSFVLLHRFLSNFSLLAQSLVYFAFVPSFAVSYTLSLVSTLIRLVAQFFYIHADIYWRRIQFSTLDNVCCMLNICKCPYFQLKISNSAHKTDRHSAKMDSSVIFLDLRTNQPTEKGTTIKICHRIHWTVFFLRIFLRKIQFDLKKTVLCCFWTRFIMHVVSNSPWGYFS